MSIHYDVDLTEQLASVAFHRMWDRLGLDDAMQIILDLTSCDPSEIVALRDRATAWQEAFFAKTESDGSD